MGGRLSCLTGSKKSYLESRWGVWILMRWRHLRFPAAELRASSGIGRRSAAGAWEAQPGAEIGLARTSRKRGA